VKNAWRDDIAIVRKCDRCNRWDSIDNFDAKVCGRCVERRGRGVRGPASHISVSRGIRITNAGRELLQQWREEERRDLA
jgi:hypothetical protein